MRRFGPGIEGMVGRMKQVGKACKPPIDFSYGGKVSSGPSFACVCACACVRAHVRRGRFFVGRNLDLNVPRERVPNTFVKPSVTRHRTFDISQVGNTFESHRLVEYGKTHGKEDETVEKLMEYYFTKERDIADPDTLAEIGKAVGLPVESCPPVIISQTKCLRNATFCDGLTVCDLRNSVSSSRAFHTWHVSTAAHWRVMREGSLASGVRLKVSGSHARPRKYLMCAGRAKVPRKR